MSTIMVCTVMIATAVAANASVIGDMNWADSVEDYSSKIQNYGGTIMTSSTEFWLTGPSDADCDSNGYAWDSGDPDYVGGWRSNAPNEYMVVKWETAIPDVAGDDLTIRLYAGPATSANVLASVDGMDFTQIGTIGSGTAGYLEDVMFDFAGKFANDVHYVKVLRVGNGPNTGIFCDSFAGVVPEPTTLTLLGCGVIALIRRRCSRK